MSPRWHAGYNWWGLHRSAVKQTQLLRTAKWRALDDPFSHTKASGKNWDTINSFGLHQANFQRCATRFPHNSFGAPTLGSGGSHRPPRPGEELAFEKRGEPTNLATGHTSRMQRSCHTPSGRMSRKHPFHGKSHSCAQLLAIARHSFLGELLGPMNDLEACQRISQKDPLLPPR